MVLLQRLDRDSRRKLKKLVEAYKQAGGSIPLSFLVLHWVLEKTSGKKVLVRDSCVTGVTPTPVDARIPEGFKILIESTSRIGLRRMRYAHEIGHIIHTYDSRYQRKIYPFNYWDTEEDICEEIAMYLLCPPEEIGRHLNEHPPRGKNLSPHYLKVLAKFFLVPKRDFEIYLKRLSPDLETEEILEQIQLCSQILEPFGGIEVPDSLFEEPSFL